MQPIKQNPSESKPQTGPETARLDPPLTWADLGRRAFWVILAGLILALLSSLAYVAYLEFYIIPDLLARRYGNGAILVHIASIAGLMLGSAVIAAWLQRWGIFQTHEKLMATHVNSTISAIENLATGRWANDSATHREAFKTGAVLGYKVGQTGAPPEEIDRNLIVEGIGRMALPDSQHVPGQDPSVVDEMSTFFDNLDSRKQRLSR